MDDGVRVCLEMLGQTGLELADLAVQLGDDARWRGVVAANAAVTWAGAASCSDRSAGLDLSGSDDDIANIALVPTALERETGAPAGVRPDQGGRRRFGVERMGGSSSAW